MKEKFVDAALRVIAEAIIEQQAHSQLCPETMKSLTEIVVLFTKRG